MLKSRKELKNGLSQSILNELVDNLTKRKFIEGAVFYVSSDAN